jgi:hypothetical protein
MMKKIFLLGGYDLEMLTIKELLEQQGEVFYDKQLSWDRAMLSRYTEQLEKYGNHSAYSIYGIELIEKNTYIPGNYHRIDHHNDYSHLPSSLEQTAALLNITLNRRQQLIAANDKGYIPAMKEQGASDGEVCRIRFADRRAQGVTEADEMSAENAIANSTKENGIIIVKSVSSRFSPVADRLYPYERLLIYTSDELIYYGAGKSRLAEIYRKEITEGRMFHGGGDSGFIGAARSAYNGKEITELKNEIVKQINP